MPNVIDLARYRGKKGAQRQPEPPDGIIMIRWEADGSHSYSISGQYARSFSLTMQALNQVAARVATDVVRSEPLP